MGWGTPRRPKISTKFGNPNPREGSDGDIQIKGTRLGAKLWGKWSGRWWDVPLSRDGVTKFGVTDSNYLSIDRDSVDVFTNKVKVASFGATTTVKDINLTGKIVITSTGTNNIIIGDSNNDVGTANIVLGINAGASLVSGNENNVFIGKNAGRLIDSTDADNNIAIGTCALENLDETSAATYVASNVAIGTSSMELFDSGGFNIAIGHNAMKAASGAVGSGISNVGIGHAALYNIVDGDSNTCLGGASGGLITSGDSNACIGKEAGNAITSGSQNISIGATSDCAATVDGQIAIGYGASTTGVYAISIGNGLQSIEDTIRVGRNVAGNYWSMDFTSSTTWAHSSDIRMKRNIQDDTLGLSL